MAVEIDLKEEIHRLVNSVESQLQRRSVRMSNELRNAELKVLSGRRTGRRYRVPFSVGKRGKKVRSRTWYTASAPGEPPANRTGALRLSWRMAPKQKAGGVVSPGIETVTPYAGYLENGTARMEPRPYRERIIEAARPQIDRIVSEPYLGGKG